MQAKDRLADRQDSTLHLRLDSQDGLGISLAEVGTELLGLMFAALSKSPNSHVECGLKCSQGICGKQ